jgi:hypothetical protein
MPRLLLRAALSAFFLLLAAYANAAEFARLTGETWDAFVPQGKEVDAIYGDYVLRNGQIVAVIAQPLATRNANMGVRAVGGCLIDLTFRQQQNDQLSAFYPGGGRYKFESPGKVRLLVDGPQAGELPESSVTGKTLTLEVEAEAADDRPGMTIRYTLEDDAPYLEVETVYGNRSKQPVSVDLSDSIRADRTFTFGFDPASQCFWADDEWFRQAYGIVAPGYEIKGSGGRGSLVQLIKDGTNKLTLPPGGSETIARRIFPGRSLLAVRGQASLLAGDTVGRISLRVADELPVERAKVTLTRDGAAYATGRTDADGRIEFSLPAGAYRGEIESIDGRRQTIDLAGGKDASPAVRLSAASYAKATITSADGRPTPAKVSFTGKNGTSDPHWGPESGEVAVRNVYYTHTGSFRQAIAPGTYDVVISYGPEHDAVFTTLVVPPDGTAELKATLRRSVDTSGWITADFHNHSSPSGDNTSSQLGRVLNILCEHIEFAPCTEHNRIDTYVPHLKRLGVEHMLATCTGMEMTGSPLPVNHQNAFPLVPKPHTQDGGGPTADSDPVTQVERLAFWDNKSDKLVQMNHPNLPQILGDRDNDGKPDAGFERMFGFIDVMEVHPPQDVFQPPQPTGGRTERKAAFHWMQMLNLGYRVPGVVNTDSHYNFHESGFYRNFIKSSTDDPARIDVMEMVHSAEAGHVVVSNGPFLSVTASAPSADGSPKTVLPGDDLAAPSGHVELAVRVQCPNWFDINRVQVFLNGRPAQELNFNRRSTPDRFHDGVVRFEARLPIELKTDTHLIVATVGEGLELGPVLGPTRGKMPPAALANPIFVDVDGGGFRPNHDLLDVPLPIDPAREISRPGK